MTSSHCPENILASDQESPALVPILDIHRAGYLRSSGLLTTYTDLAGTRFPGLVIRI
jgi:hypothetical protein